MPRSPAPYAERLVAALRRQDVSVRGLAKLLSDREGGTVETKRRNVYKWLNGSEPEPLRAATLAIILDDPDLALVHDGPRSSRLAELEAAVAQEKERRERALRAVTVRLAEIEAALGLQAQPEARRRTEG